jgi:hypothetical protein
MLAACGGGDSGNADGGEGPTVDSAGGAEPGGTVIAGGEFTQSFEGTPGPGGANGQAFVFGSLDGLAEFLGISKEQLQADLQLPGATQAGVAALYGKSRTDLKAFLTSANDKALNDAVATGRMEQAQADQLKMAFASGLDRMIDAPGGIGGGGGPVTIRPGG